jgi:DNA relaxase NicK
MVRFDGYTATTQAANPYQLAELFGPGFEQFQGRGFHTFGHRLAFKDPSGSEVGFVMWGGSQGDRSMIEVKGEQSPRVVEALRSRYPHRVTRADSCADFDRPGAFESLLGVCMAVKRRHRLKGRREGDWEDFPELGRSQYLGSSKSVSQLRLYEKGRQPEYRHLDRSEWVRAELQVRPAKQAMSSFSEVSPIEVWGASGWTRELAGQILAEHVDPHPAGTVWRKTSLEARLDWICRQAGPTLVELLGEVGSWECVGLTLGEKIRELREGKEPS